MHYLQQPKKSKLCGQTCLAMITDKPLEKIIELLGSKGTSTKRITETLTKLGFHHSGKLIPRRTQPLPSLAICKVRREWSKSGNWHWVVLSNGVVYDPDPREEEFAMLPIKTFDEKATERSQKLSSYIAIY